MSSFPSAAHLSSWAGLCPGNRRSAGKEKSGRTTRGSLATDNYDSMCVGCLYEKGLLPQG